jgi:hypothetical protein
LSRWVKTSNSWAVAGRFKVDKNAVDTAVWSSRANPDIRVAAFMIGLLSIRSDKN